MRETDSRIWLAKKFSPPRLALPAVKNSDTEPAARAATRRPSQFPRPARVNVRTQYKLSFAASAANTR